MKTKRKRIISLLLVVVLIIGLVPVVGAATDDVPEASTEETIAAAPQEDISQDEMDHALWDAIHNDLPDPIEDNLPCDPDNLYPYGLPVDNFFPASFYDMPDAVPMAQGNIPDEMWDNTILRALEKTGFNVQKLKDTGRLYSAQYISGSLKTNDPSVLSNIGYYSGSGALANGDETVADSSTVSGKTPNIKRFEQTGMVCASFVTYYLCNYLPNIEGVDTSLLYEEVKARGADSRYQNVYYLTTVNVWADTLNALSSRAGSGVTKYTDSTTAYANLVPGDVIVFSDYRHIAIYAGTYDLYSWGTSMGKYHFIIHVGNSRGPEISTAEYMADSATKPSRPVTWYHLDFNDITNKTGFIEVYKKDPNGKSLAGARFTAVNQETQESYYIGPTDSTGYAKSGEVPLGTYVVTESVFPTGYESNGTSQWTVTLTADTPNQTVTINAVNKLITGSLKIQKATNTGKSLNDWVFGVYTDSACTKPISGSPFTSNSSGVVMIDGLTPSTYYVKELSESTRFWVTDNGVKAVQVNGHATSTVTITNTQYGYLKIIKQTTSGEDLGGWRFDIYRASDNVSVGSYISQEDGTITTDALLPGDYLVYERIPDDSIYWCETANPQNTTIIEGETVSVTFTNRLKPAKISILKVDITGEPLAGAEFLLEWSVDGKAWAPISYTDSQYVLEGTCTSEGLVDGKLVSGSTGIVEFTDLHPNRLYRLTETAAPEGYQLLPEYAYEGGISVVNDLTVSLTVVNAPEFRLPETGSNTLVVYPFTVAAALCACAAMIFLLSRKARKRV